MDDQQKTQAKHIAELQELRRSQEEESARRAARVGLDAQIEVIGNFDVLRASGINLSASGICFEVAEDLLFEMRFVSQGKIHQHRARLMWMKRIGEGGCRLGFNFVD